MTSIDKTGFASLETAGRLVNPVVKEPGTVAGRFVFRGEFAIEFAQLTEREKRPPVLVSQQVIAASNEGSSTLSFFTGSLLSFEYLAPLSKALSGTLAADGVYIAFCENIELDESYCVQMDGVNWYILPLDESSVYIEVLELLDIEKSDLKKLSSVGKIDAIVDGMKSFKRSYKSISYEEGLKAMGPVKDPGENRPV